jgi:hypothetical protein
MLFKKSNTAVGQEVLESMRKIEELDKIIDVFKYELNTLRISADTNRMVNVLKKTVNLNKDSINRLKQNKSSSVIGMHKKDRYFLVKSHVTREKIRRDKVINDLKEINSNE